jgi:NADH-quinone oxidoreductase subunit K
VLVVAAAEAAVGFAIIINLFRDKHVVDVDQYNELRG